MPQELISETFANEVKGLQRLCTYDALLTCGELVKPHVGYPRSGAHPSGLSFLLLRSYRKAIGDSNVVINLIGRDFETHRYRFEDINIEAAERIASVSAELGVKRLIHFSALGAGGYGGTKGFLLESPGC